MLRFQISSIASFLFFLLSLPLFVSARKLASLCNESVCKLPNCFCSGFRPPNGLAVESVPQFVMLSFDDSLNEIAVKNYAKIFGNGRRNPDGCPIRGTFFVNHEWTDYWWANALYAQGHEIATHSITHESTQAFIDADLNRWVKEIGGMKKILEIFGRIKKSDIKGFRSPFLQPGGDAMFEGLNRSGMTYDSTLVAGENSPPIWPYTLEFQSTQDCKVGPCPKTSHPGTWEVPLVQYVDGTDDKNVCSMIDACRDKGTKDSAYDMLLDNFFRHYASNRAPFPMFMHVWFKATDSEYRFEALQNFLDTILLLPDVYIVTISDVIDWIKNPVPCEKFTSNGTRTCTLEAIQNWSCRSKELASRRPVCPQNQKQNCILKRKVGNALRDRRLTTCSLCPNEFPWLGNPDGNLLAMMDMEIEEKQFWFPPRGKNLTKPVPKVVFDPFATFKTMDPRTRFKLYLKKMLKNKMANPNVMAKVFGDL